MPARGAPLPGETVADNKYEIVSVLGRGGMGTVYAARHAISGRRVALKWLDPEEDGQASDAALKRFLLEARMMGTIEHPNVVGVLDVGVEGHAAYLVMEILRGESLRDMLDREKTVAPERALAVMLPAMQGVEAAHRAGVVHRDLKPGNIFVVTGSDGEPVTTKVLDFGISKFHDENDARALAHALTQTGQVLGTPHYMSPEQVRGAKLDARTDEWALATILYEMLSGRVPFAAPTCSALFVKIATESFAPLDSLAPELPPGLVGVIHRALAKSPADRYPDVAAFARALEPYAGGVTFHTPPTPHASISSPMLSPARAGISRPPVVRAPEQPTAVARTAHAPTPSYGRPSVSDDEADALIGSNDETATAQARVVSPAPYDGVTVGAPRASSAAIRLTAPPSPTRTRTRPPTRSRTVPIVVALVVVSAGVLAAAVHFARAPGTHTNAYAVELETPPETTLTSPRPVPTVPVVAPVAVVQPPVAAVAVADGGPGAIADETDPTSVVHHRGGGAGNGNGNGTALHTTHEPVAAVHGTPVLPTVPVNSAGTPVEPPRTGRSGSLRREDF